LAIRYLKIVFVIFISLVCLFYAGQNVANLNACYQAFAYVMSMADHQAYPDSFFPAIQNPALIWLTLVLIVTLEFAAGLLAAKGAWDLWSARKAPATGIVVWMGLFGAVGGALFQMWETDAGSHSLEGAFQIFGACAFTFLIVNMADD